MTTMDLRAQLDAALKRIDELEKELENVRAHTGNSSNISSTAASKVLTRAAAAALASKRIKCESDQDEARSDSAPQATPRTRFKSMQRHSAPKAVPIVAKPTMTANPTSNEPNITDTRTLRGKQTKPVEKPIQPTPSKIITNQQFVPMHLKLPCNAAQAQMAAKVASVNILSASSSMSEVPTPQSPTSMSTGSKRKSMSQVKPSVSKRPSSMHAGISKSRKDKSGLVAKCTEPRPGQTRYWTEDEHERFLEAIAQYGEKAYVAISNYVETRTPKQVRTHAQKFQMKVARLARERAEAGEMMELPAGMLPNSIGIDASKVICTPPLNATPMQVEAAARAASEIEARRQAKILEAEREAQARAEAEALARAQHGAAIRTAVSESPLSSMDGEMDVDPFSTGDDDVDGSGSATTTCNSEVANTLTEAVSSVSDVSSDGLADPYLSYIGGEAVQDDATEWLPKSTVNNRLINATTTNDDDLEDLDECGELPMASLVNFGL